MWQLIGRGSDVHVIPVKDLQEHARTIDCWCKPRRDTQAQDVVIHNARDGRERHEPDWKGVPS